MITNQIRMEYLDVIKNIEYNANSEIIDINKLVEKYN